MSTPPYHVTRTNAEWQAYCTRLARLTKIVRLLLETYDPLHDPGALVMHTFAARLPVANALQAVLAAVQRAAVLEAGDNPLQLQLPHLP